MIPRQDERGGLVAHVDTSLCVSCGICAGSCAPMVVGPPGRSGRDQLAAVKTFIGRVLPGPEDVVVVACARGAGGIGEMERFEGALVYPIQCAGSLHSSIVEYLVRAGAGGVMIVSCPVGDCRNREGAKWLEQRLFHEREAELKARVDRGRVRWVEAGAGERGVVARRLADFRASIAPVLPVGEVEIDLLALCERAEEEVGT
jgi:coenzyme F420-reducing hydrogenase delta subunit